MEEADLATLEVVEVFIEYDGPRLFVCRDVNRQLFLAISVEERAESAVWLYVPISEERLEQVRIDRLDLHDAFASPEDGAVFQVTTFRDGTPPEIRRLPSVDIPRKWLVEPGVFLNLPD